MSNKERKDGEGGGRVGRGGIINVTVKKNLEGKRYRI
jgi:hypothetical protein